MKTYKSQKQQESYKIGSNDGEDNETSEPELSTSFDQHYYPTSVSEAHLMTEKELKDLERLQVPTRESYFQDRHKDLVPLFLLEAGLVYCK